MPAYISHAIFGNEIYDRSKNDNKLFKSEVDLDSLKTFSVAIDPADLSKDVTKNPHSYNTQGFLIKMIKYIKENNLIEDKYALAYLYGHIGHYFFDTAAHPFIYYIEKGCKRFGMIPPHFMVEGYISAYLSEELLHKDIMEVKKEFFNKGNRKSISQMGDTLYRECYNITDFKACYWKFINLFTLIEWAYKETFVTKQLVELVFTYNQFLKVNNLTREEMSNKNNQTWRHPITGEKHNESILDLYKMAMERTLYACVKVNDYLYGSASIDELLNIFPNISYETGLDISLGENMKFNRSLKLK